MIICPRKEIILPSAGCHFLMQGFLRIQIRRPDGRVRWDSGFFPNKILNSGRNNMATQANWLDWCHVGTGSTPPTATDTQLQAFVCSTNTIVANSTSTQGSAPYFGYRRRTFRFAVGAGQGGQNLSEAGIGWNSTGSTLVSRALIIDPITQLPTSVTPLADELLDVTYELRYYPPLGDSSNSVTMNGVIYTTTTRAASVTDAIWSTYIGQAIGIESAAGSYWAAYDGNIGTITQFPSGTVAYLTQNNGYNLGYSNNSYQRKMGTSVGASEWNLGLGIRSARLLSKAGAYQTQFSSNPGGNRIPKTNVYTMVVEWVVSWSEYV